MKKFFYLLGLMIAVSTTTLAGNITDCTEISEPGTYYLTGDITNSSKCYCIDIKANNVVLDCQGHGIDGDDTDSHGIRVYRKKATTTNITLKNCFLSDWTGANIYLRYANGNRLENITSTSSSGNGLYLWSSNSTTVIDLNSSSNGGSGIYLQYSTLSSIRNCTLNSNENGIHLMHSELNNITGCTFESNRNGVLLDHSHVNTISGSRIENNLDFGIYLYFYKGLLFSYSGSIGENLIYNNIFKNVRNYYSNRNVRRDYWNSSRGGNYWTNPAGNGYSDTCTDSDQDGFCDRLYEITYDGKNIDYFDYLPLSRLFVSATSTTTSTTSTTSTTTTATTIASTTTIVTTTTTTIITTTTTVVPVADGGIIIAIGLLGVIIIVAILYYFMRKIT
jgi:parallel beta-helix repeat protein